MPQDATCPKCKHVFPVTEARHPVGVRCPGCDAELTVEFRKRPTPIEPGVSPYELAVKQGKPATAEAAIPPTPKRPRRDDDEEEEGEGEKSTGKGSSIIVLIAGLTALFFAIGGLGATGYILATNLDTSDSTLNNLSNQNNFGQSQNGNRFGGNPGNNQGGGNPVNNQGGTPGFQNQPPPRRNFEFAPISGTPPTIKPPTLSADASSLQLPSKVGAVAIGGGGRYIVMHFPQSGQLGIFDVSTAFMTIAQTDSVDVKIAAGLSSIVTLVPSANTMRVFSIAEPKTADQKLKITKLFDSPVPVNGLGAIAMGSRTNGPVIGVGTFGNIHALDISGGSVVEIEEGRGSDDAKLHWGGNCLLRATPDGMAYISTDNLDKGKQAKLAQVENKQWRSRDVKLVPFTGADGLLYGNGIVTNLKGEDQRYGGVGLGSDEWFVPAACGNTGAFLKVVQTGGKGFGAKKVITVSIHNKGNANRPAEGTPILTGLPELEGLWNPFGQAARERPFDQHLFLLPEAKLLLILSTNMDKLQLRKIDLK